MTISPRRETIWTKKKRSVVKRRYKFTIHKTHKTHRKNVCDYFPTARDGESAICQKIREKVLFPARREDFAGDEEGSFVPGARVEFFF